MGDISLVNCLLLTPIDESPFQVYDDWCNLQQQLLNWTAAGYEHATLDAATAKVDGICVALLNLKLAAQATTDSFTKYVEDAISLPSSKSDAATCPPSDLAPYLPKNKEDEDFSRPYIGPSYRWLLDNLNNPYPSDRLRESIASATNSKRKAVDDWFTDARKRIGWGRIYKKYFHTRKEMIQVATRYFRPKPNDSQNPIDDDFPGVSVQFVSMQGSAEGLYEGKTKESKLAEAITMDAAQASYPSPQSLASTLDSDSESESPRASCEPLEQSLPIRTQESSEPVTKRRRSSASDKEPVTMADTRLTPPASPKASSSTIPLEAQAPLSSESSKSRKRHVSDSDASFPAPKRSHKVGRSLRSVSDPTAETIPFSTAAYYSQWVPSQFDAAFFPEATFDESDVPELVVGQYPSLPTPEESPRNNLYDDGYLSLAPAMTLDAYLPTYNVPDSLESLSFLQSLPESFSNPFQYAYPDLSKHMPGDSTFGQVEIVDGTESLRQLMTNDGASELQPSSFNGFDMFKTIEPYPYYKDSDFSQVDDMTSLLNSFASSTPPPEAGPSKSKDMVSFDASTWGMSPEMYAMFSGISQPSPSAPQPQFVSPAALGLGLGPIRSFSSKRHHIVSPYLRPPTMRN